MIIADYADNPGAHGDAPALLWSLLAAGVEDAWFGPLIDAEAAGSLQSVAIGDGVTLEIGGKTAPAFGGVTGTVLWHGEGRFIGTRPILGGLERNFGPMAVVCVQGIDVLIVTIA